MMTGFRRKTALIVFSMINLAASIWAIESFAWDSVRYPKVHQQVCIQEAEKRGYSVTTTLQLCEGKFSGYCLNEAWQAGYSMSQASELCRGRLNEACFRESRQFGNSISTSAQLCSGRGSEDCYRHLRETGVPLARAHRSCLGQHPRLCWEEGLRRGHGLDDLTQMCSMGNQDASCLQFALSLGFTLREATQSCRGVENAECFSELVKDGASLRSASQSCLGEYSSTCYRIARDRAGMSPVAAQRVCGKQKLNDECFSRRVREWGESIASATVRCARE